MKSWPPQTMKWESPRTGPWSGWTARGWRWSGLRTKIWFSAWWPTLWGHSWNVIVNAWDDDGIVVQVQSPCWLAESLLCLVFPGWKARSGPDAERIRLWGRLDIWLDILRWQRPGVDVETEFIPGACARRESSSGGFNWGGWIVVNGNTFQALLYISFVGFVWFFVSWSE